MITFVTLRDVWSRLSQESLERVFSDWEMMIGFEAELTSEEIHIAADVAEVEAVMDCDKVVIATRIEGTCEGPIYFAFPSTLAMEIVGEVLMIPEQARAAKVEEGLGESEIEAFREMANLLCGSSNMIFQGLEKNLRISQSVDHLQVWGGPNSGVDGGNDKGRGITDSPQGLKLQCEGHDVRYRNTWIKKLDLKKADTDFKSSE